MFEKYLSAFFTRKQGFEIVSTNLGLSKSETIEILIKYIPQGNTPKKTQILGYWNDYIVISYFETTSETDFFVLLLFIKPKNETSFIEESLFDEKNQKYALLMGRNQITFETIKNEWNKIDELKIPISDENIWEHILFSLLAGDNIIVISKDLRNRQEFFEFIVHELPVMFLKYNRFVLEAKELKGNGNILGLSERPEEKNIKQEFGVDTIIIDLDNGTISGEGMKISPIVKEMAKAIVESPNLFKELILSITNKWISYNWDTKKEENAQDQFLLQKIKNRVFGEEKEETDFFSEF